MCIKVVSRVVYRWLMPQSRIRGSSRQMMHRRRSLSPAVLTRAQIPTSSKSAAASSARRLSVSDLAGPAGAGGKTWQSWARSTYQPSSISFLPAIGPSSMAA
jgi:hypothetical protein